MPNYRKKIRRAANRYGVRPELLEAQLTQESGLNPDAVSPAGARGIAQFIPDTAKRYGVDLYDGRAGDDIDGAARHMRDLLKQFGGDERLALAAYNAGAGAVEEHGGVPPYAETQNYVKSILGAAGTGRRRASYHGGSERPAPESNPQVDRQARQALLLSYLQERDKPGALLDLAPRLQALEQQPTEYRPAAPSGPAKRAPRRSENLLELFYRGDGGINVDNGQVVNRDFVSGHEDHVHVATRNPAQVKRLADIAQNMGLTVTSTTGGKHTEGSFHYSGQALDVAGDPELMRRYARKVASLYGIRR